MNKLAPIALILLLTFGGTLWFLANHEFNASIQARMVKVGDYYTEKNVSITRVNIDQTTGTGKITDISLNSFEQTKQQNLFNIGEVNFTFQVNTLHSSIIIIDEILIKDTEFFITSTSSDEMTNNIQALYQVLNDKIALIKDSRKQKAEAYLQVNNIQMINTKTFLNGKPIKVVDQVTLKPVGTNNGLPASLFGIEVLRKALETLITTQSK